MIYKDSEYKDLVEHLSSESGVLVLFIGLYTPDKKEALKHIKKNSLNDVMELDFNTYVSKSEEQTLENFESLFREVEGTSAILHFNSGDKLCGAYTGYTHSKVKYATPQERHFLNTFRSYSGSIIIDITEEDSADETILRAADHIVKFPLPKSPLRRFVWHLKNYSLHGYDIKTKRPEKEIVEA